MEEVKEIKKPEITPAEIDQDVLETMAQENILKAVESDKEMNRVLLNCMCEMLSQFKQMQRSFDDFMNFVSICSADKVNAFFGELKQNVDKETTRQKVKKQIEKSHKKSEKADKVVKFTPKTVK